jgi:hypothetical protein
LDATVGFLGFSPVGFRQILVGVGVGVGRLYFPELFCLVLVTFGIVVVGYLVLLD